jgi:hypothetical protein
MFELVLLHTQFPFTRVHLYTYNNERKASVGEPGQGRQNGADRTGQAEEDRQKGIDRRDSQNRTGGMDRQNRAYRTGLSARTVRVGLSFRIFIHGSYIYE